MLCGKGRAIDREPLKNATLGHYAYWRPSLPLSETPFTHGLAIEIYPNGLTYWPNHFDCIKVGGAQKAIFIRPGSRDKHSAFATDVIFGNSEAYLVRIGSLGYFQDHKAARNGQHHCHVLGAKPAVTFLGDQDRAIFRDQLDPSSAALTSPR